MATALRLQLEILANGASATVGELRRIREESARAAAESRQNTASQQQGNTLLGGGIAELAFRYNNVVGALQNLRATAQPVYDALIASNEKLNAQILSSQTNLASSTRIFKGDREVFDPTEKIQASAGKLRAAIKQIEIDTQELVGVTSSQVNELFQITLTNAGALNNQSKQFPDAIAAATSLTKGWAASLKVVGIPLNQARQEINSIIKGQITQDSLLAKNLNITNQQVEAWRSQGKLVDELNKRLEVFVAGNGIAARSIEGISSNILDLSERITRNIGEPFLEPTINALAEVEKYLKGAESSITQLFSQLSAEIIGAGGSIGEAFAPVGKTLLEIGADIGPIALSAIKGLLQVFVQLSNVVAPLANLLLGAGKVLADFAATDLGGVVVQTGVIVLVMSQLATIIGGLAIAALPMLWGAVIATVTSFGTLYAATVAVATGNTAMALSIPAVQTALRLLAGEAIALNLALIPLTAAIGLAVLVRTTKDLEDANNALDAYGNRILATADAYNVIGVELNQYNKIVKDGGALTDEQIKRQKQLKASAAAQLESIQEQIKELKNLKTANATQATQRDNDIKQLEALAVKFDKAAGGIKLQSKLLEDLGGTAELAAKKLENLNRQINNEGGGEKQAFDTALKDKIALIQSEVNQKRLSIEAARAELESVKSNTKAELDIRNSAKDAIDKLYDGRIAKIKELIEVGNIQTGSGTDELAKIRDDSTLEAATRRKAGQQIVTIRKEQIQAESAAITAGQSQIAALQSQQRIGEARADEETTKLKLAEIGKRLEANKVVLENATSDTERAKLRAEDEKDRAETEKLDAELSARRRKRAIEDYDERRDLIKAQNDLGLIDRGTYNKQILNNDAAQVDAEIAQQQQAYDLLASNDTEGQEAVNKRINELRSKRVEIARTYDKADLQRQTEYYDQELTALEAFKNDRLIGEDEFVQQKAQNRIAQADAEIIVANRELERLGANDIEGRNAIAARINDLSNKRIKALEESYAAELVLIKDREAKALELVKQSQEQRAIELQKLVNSRSIRQEDADKERNRENVSKQRAELQQARDFEVALARTFGATRSPEAERTYQQQVREARSRTLSVTLQLLQTEGTELERLRTLTLKGIEDGVAARTRAADLDLSKIADVRGQRERSTKDAEAGVAREVAAIEIATKALERQNGLIVARNNLQKANFDAQTSGNELELAGVVRSLEIRKELDTNTNLSFKERQILEEQLTSLVGNSRVRENELLNRKAQIEQNQLQAKREGVLFEQAIAKAALSIEQQKIDLSNQRLVIEARIAEFKAKQGVLDARALVDQTELNNRKSIEAANLALTQAKALQPGRERDRAIAEAENKLAIAKTEADTNAANALQGVDLANQQVDLAKQNTGQALEQVKSQGAVKKLQNETLDIQQKMVLKQLEAAEAAKLYAAALERAKLASQGIIIEAPVNNLYRDRQRPTIGIDPNADLTRGYTNIPDNKPYVPAKQLTPAEQAAADYQQSLDRAKRATAPPVQNINRIDPSTDFTRPIIEPIRPLQIPISGGGDRDKDMSKLIQEVKTLQDIISSRPPTPIVANFNAPDDDGMDKLFKLQRASLRV
jgi:hypothetical protein